MSETLMHNEFGHERLESIRYPEAHHGDVVDVYHGIPVADPYRWMEQDTPERDEWMQGQGILAEVHGPDGAVVDALVERYREFQPDIWDGIPFKRGDREFFYRTINGQNYYVLIERLSEDDERVIHDPNSWREDDSLAPESISISPKGKYLCEAVSPNDTDRQEWRIKDLDTLQPLDDTLPVTKDTYLLWLDDESGFFYERVNDDGERSVYFHGIGTTHEEDVSYFAPEKGDTTCYYSVLSDDERWLYVIGYPNTGINSIDVIDLQDPEKNPVRLIEPDDRDTETFTLHNLGDTHLLTTQLDSPKGRVVAKRLGQEDMQEIIPETEHTLEDAEFVDNRIVVTYSDGINRYLKIYELDGTEVQTILPKDGIGKVSFRYDKRDDSKGRVEYQGPITPEVTYSLDVSTGKQELLQEPMYKVDTSGMEVELRYGTSKDGTEVPMIVCKPRDLEFDGSNPTIMTGYGGFADSVEPDFNPAILPWLEAGGIYVTAALRGGAEFGSEWHEAGKKLRKQNVFDDFISCAEELIDAGITSPEKLAIQGGSNGGLLVAATMLQRPDLCSVVMPGVGLLDMLRFDKGGQEASGMQWRPEFGSTDNEDEFLNLLGYSPVHNVVPAEYPTVYGYVGESDDRVLPWNSYKFIAAMQSAQLADNPILLDIESNIGHGISGIERYYRRCAKDYAFLMKTFGIQHSYNL